METGTIIGLLPFPGVVKAIVIAFICKEKDVIDMLKRDPSSLLWRLCLKERDCFTPTLVDCLLCEASTVEYAQFLIKILPPRKTHYLNAFMHMCDRGNLDMVKFWADCCRLTKEDAFLGVQQCGYSNIDTCNQVVQYLIQRYNLAETMPERKQLFEHLCNHHLFRAAQWLYHKYPIPDVKDYNTFAQCIENGDLQILDWLVMRFPSMRPRTQIFPFNGSNERSITRAIIKEYEYTCLYGV